MKRSKRLRRWAERSDILHNSVIHSTKGASYYSLWQANARRAERSHRGARKKKEALKGLRKRCILYAAVAPGHPHAHSPERKIATAMGGELSENGIRSEFFYDAPTERHVLFGTAVPMASLGEAPRLAIGYHTTHRWCVTAGMNKALLALPRPEITMWAGCLHQRVKGGMKAPQNTIVYSLASAAHCTIWANT